MSNWIVKIRGVQPYGMNDDLIEETEETIFIDMTSGQAIALAIEEFERDLNPEEEDSAKPFASEINCIRAPEIRLK